MEIPTSIVEDLLKKAMEKAGKTYDRFGLSELPTAINAELPSQYRQIGSRYIYDTVYLSIEKARKSLQENVRLNQSCLDSIARFIGFRDIANFRLAQLPGLRKEMLSVEGAWYSVVRSSSGLPYILVSPVKISISENQKAILILKGLNRTYRGEVKWTGGSMSTLITSEDQTKSLHMAFKVGLSKYPKVIMGVFSGISTAGEPVAGKDILYKSDIPFEEMKSSKISIESLNEQEESVIPPPIIRYLSDFDKNYIKVIGMGTLDLDELYYK